jgi:nucleoside-diphosphate-sugar epimerase
MRISITGGAGFIGRHISEHFQDRFATLPSLAPRSNTAQSGRATSNIQSQAWIRFKRLALGRFAIWPEACAQQSNFFSNGIEQGYHL